MGLFSPAVARPLLTVAEMDEADRAAIAGGRSGLALMEAAGQAVARAVIGRWTRRPVAVLAGPGNNGGDGWVAARALHRRGWPVTVWTLGDPAPRTEDAAVMARRFRGRVRPLTEETLAQALPAPGSGGVSGGAGVLVIDALFGAGLTRPLTGAAWAAVSRINALGLDCLAVDMPSGLHGDSGRVLGDAAGAAACRATVTFFHPKPGHLLYPGRALVGALEVADIGIPAAVLGPIAPQAMVNGPGLWPLPRPGPLDHKYRRGHAVVIAGGALTGAARLAARAARRVGAGLVTLAGPPESLPLLAADQPGVLVWGLTGSTESTSGSASRAQRGPAHHGPLAALLADGRRNAVLLGPGRGRGRGTADEALALVESGRAVVLDADALTSLAGRRSALAAALAAPGAGPCVLTPHDGEFAALFGGEVGSGPGDRLARARAAAAAVGAVVVSKGADCVIAAPDGRAAVTANAPPWLATAGSGDVLAGLILGLLAQGLPAFEAAAAAVWLHGETANRIGPGLIAEDLAETLPRVLAALPGAELDR